MSALKRRIESYDLTAIWDSGKVIAVALLGIESGTKKECLAVAKCHLALIEGSLAEYERKWAQISRQNSQDMLDWSSRKERVVQELKEIRYQFKAGEHGFNWRIVSQAIGYASAEIGIIREIIDDSELTSSVA